ncbi:MAG: ATP-binding protein [Proteobacteria bacterium]|nr:ATP-binding protein [Pseudomonadota bacterium]
MLIEFTVKNYRSIKGEQTLSLVKAKGEARNCFVPDVLQSIALSSSAVIYGANAAGKSNLVEALAFMDNMVRKSATSKQQGDKIPAAPFLFDEKTTQEPSEFEVVFISEGVKFQYGFSLNKERVLEEWLIAFPKGRPQEWFSRTYSTKNNKSEYKFGNHLTGQKQVWKNTTRNNALFLSTSIQLNSEQLQPVFNWFQSKLYIINSSKVSSNFTIEQCDTTINKELILQFLQSVNIDIYDVKIKKEKFDPAILPKEMPASVKEFYIDELTDKEVIKEVKSVHKTKNGNLVALDLEEESDGTQKFFALSGLWLDALKNGDVLVIDELHNSLHPKLVKYLVELFHNKKTNPNNAQLIFTTHDTSILNQDVFSRDQIWFCEKDEHQATILYPLTDFSPRKGRENLEQSYMSGRYGGIPFIKEFELIKEA